jgi:hypothetical protein
MPVPNEVSDAPVNRRTPALTVALPEALCRLEGIHGTVDAVSG